jgi:dihydropteroate synthase
LAFLVLGSRVFDVSRRALVMGIANRTPDSFSEKGRYFRLDALLSRCEEMVREGADIIDVGGVKAGPGPEVSESEEMDRVLPVVEELARRFDVAISVDTWRASVVEEAFSRGAVLGNDISGFADPGYLAAAARHGAAVVATHIRLAPRVPDPDPHYDDVVAAVAARLSSLARQAEEAGVERSSIVVDAGLDLGKTSAQSLELLRASGELAGLGYPLLLSASNKTFLGDLLGLEVGERRDASLAAVAVAVSLGARVVRVHDVAGSRRVCDALEALEMAREPL